jgi:DNA-binding transcriptional LysR family regulator
LLLVLPASHPEVRHPEDLRVRSLAAFARGCTYRQCAEDWLAGGTQGRPRHMNVLELSSYHAILACVTAGSAIAILPKSLLALHREAGEVRTMPVRRAHTFLVRRAGFTTRAYETFLQALLDSRDERRTSTALSTTGVPASSRIATDMPTRRQSASDSPLPLP